MSFPGSCNAFIIFFKIEHLHFFEICPSTSLAFFQVSHTDPSVCWKHLYERCTCFFQEWHHGSFDPPRWLAQKPEKLEFTKFHQIHRGFTEITWKSHGNHMEITWKSHGNHPFRWNLRCLVWGSWTQPYRHTAPHGMERPSCGCRAPGVWNSEFNVSRCQLLVSYIVLHRFAAHMFGSWELHASRFRTFPRCWH